MPSRTTVRKFITLSMSLAVIATLSWGTFAVAVCNGTAKGPINIQVEQCSVVNVTKRFSKSESLPVWLAEMRKADIQKFLRKYNGILVTGTVKKSNAVIKTGLSKSKHAFRGQNVTVFTSSIPTGCANLAGKQLNGILTEECCDGGGEVPCLLDHPFRLDNAKPFVTAGKPPPKTRSKLLRRGKELFESGNFTKATSYLREAKKRGQLDLRGKYMLAVGYERQDSCGGSVKLLLQVQQAWANGDTRGAEDSIVGPAIFLLARCYAQLGKSSKSVKALNFLLRQPKKFRKEIRQGMIHSDFTWIKKTASYKGYRRQASRVLRAGKE